MIALRNDLTFKLNTRIEGRQNVGRCTEHFVEAVFLHELLCMYLLYSQTSPKPLSQFFFTGPSNFFALRAVSLAGERSDKYNAKPAATLTTSPPHRFYFFGNAVEYFVLVCRHATKELNKALTDGSRHTHELLQAVAVSKTFNDVISTLLCLSDFFNPYIVFGRDEV
jgi:hypothetical protein